MKVKVWNDNKYPYSEEFRGEKLSIEPNKFIEMDREDAVMFLGQFSSIVRDVDGNPSPKSYKRLRIEIPNEPQKAKKD